MGQKYSHIFLLLIITDLIAGRKILKTWSVSIQIVTEPNMRCFYMGRVTAVAVLRLDHPVHVAPTPETGYELEPLILCISRNTAHHAVSQKLNPLAADLLEAWQRGEETVAEAVERVAAEHDTQIGPAFVEKLSALIADFIDDGIIVGGRA